MKITRIVQQLKSKDRVSLFIDDQYRLSLTQDQLLESRLRVGDTINETDISRLLELSELGKALAQAYNYLSFRSRSRQEIQRYLKGKHWEADLINSVIDRLEEQGHLNDADFVREWIENRQLTSPRSRRQLQAELQEKGIASDTIHEALASITVDDEVQVVSRLISAKRLRQRYTNEQKLISYLAGKGFSYASIKQALEVTP